MRDATNLLACHQVGLSLDDFFQRPPRDECVDQLAIQTLGKLAQLSEGDATFRFRALRLVEGRTGDAEAARLLALSSTQCLADGTQPAALGRLNTVEPGGAVQRLARLIETKTVEF